MPRTRDTRITGYEPLLSPAALLDELPLGDAPADTVERTRAEVRAVLDGSDDRLLVIAGPCSVHDPAAALDYAGRLAVAPRRAPGRPADRDARLLREAAHRDRLEGPDQRPGHGRRPRRAPRPAHRPAAAPRHRRPGPAGGLRVAGPDHPAVHRGHRDLGRDRRPDHREPGPPPARLGPVDAGRVQERHRRRRPGGGRRVPGLGRRAHVLRRYRQRRGRGGDHGRQPGDPRDPARRPRRPQLRAQSRGQGPGPDHRRGPAPPPDGRRQPRQQRQGPPPPAARGGQPGRAGGRRGARPDRRHAGELPARGPPGARPPGHPHLRPERHRRLHGHRHHRRRTDRPNRRRPDPP